MSDKTTEKKPRKKQWNGSKENINREGRPDNPWAWRELFLEELEADSKKREGWKRKKVIAEKLVEKAEEGDVQAYDRIADRMEGKAPQFIDHTSEGERIDGFIIEFVKPNEGETSGSA